MDAYARTKLTAEDFVPILNIDGEIAFDEITPDLMCYLRRLEPFGMDNREPVFTIRNLRLAQPPKILKEKHIKLRLSTAIGNGKPSRPLDALGWRMAERIQKDPLLAGDLIDLAFTLEENTHPDFGGLQLIIRDFRRANVLAEAQSTAIS
jgi:single-stranded-DNA-specific exonuclease